MDYSISGRQTMRKDVNSVAHILVQQQSLVVYNEFGLLEPSITATRALASVFRFDSRKSLLYVHPTSSPGRLHTLLALHAAAHYRDY
eukprot:CAMPEP_0177604044 /NCGR_PEP_ID=MMETSP0419_2-20121207/15890_1 /TAXON_ID=582737 /ORGANISM="Tetraselmis sp., Strain GSL018" /LENGTH=86 /DNA_ID=CAMNT_0019097965 /DNA_START=268 /DNA_END=528 /DNA_ORIENTATION=-